MSTADNSIDILELRQLLTTIVDNRLNICFRFRMTGEMWQPNYMRVLKVTEKGVVLNDETRNKLVVIQDLASIIQFEIDSQFHRKFQPYHHYTISGF